MAILTISGVVLSGLGDFPIRFVLVAAFGQIVPAACEFEKQRFVCGTFD